MSRRSLKDLKSQLEKQERSNNNNSGGMYYPHWKLPENGVTKIRILEDPDQENPLIVYVNYLEHRLHIGDNVVNIPCPKNNGKNQACPICELSSKLYKNGNEEKGKYFYRDAYAILRGIITKDGLEYGEDEENVKGQVKAFRFSYQLSKKLKVEIGKLDDEDVFWDLEEGLDFSIEKVMKQVKEKEFANYDLSSGFVRKMSEIPEKYREDIPEEPLSALLPEIPSYDEVSELLDKHQRDVYGKGKSDDSDDDKVETEDDLKAKLNRNKSEKKRDVEDDKSVDTAEAVDAIAALTDDDDDDDDILSLLGDD